LDFVYGKEWKLRILCGQIVGHFRCNIVTPEVRYLKRLRRRFSHIFAFLYSSNGMEMFLERMIPFGVSEHVQMERRLK
jgi:hypothetical protein